MKIAIKEVLKSHYEKTGEYVTQVQLAREMVKAGVYKNQHSAQNMLQYNISGKAKSLDVGLLNFLSVRFGITINDMIRWNYELLNQKKDPAIGYMNKLKQVLWFIN